MTHASKKHPRPSMGAKFRLRRSRHALVSMALAAWCTAATPADTVVLRVGQTAFSVSDLQPWLARLLLTSAGESQAHNDPNLLAARRRAALDMALLTEEGRSVDGENARHTRDAALALALERALRKEQSISDDEIAAFFAQHQERYTQPRALRLWRILVGDEAQAKEIILKVNGQPKPVYAWGDLAREHSVDDATKQRDGSLGFVRADGSTDVPELRVDRALFTAADLVADGQIVPQPVPEGSHFAVVWRRGTRPARAQTLAQERDNIREILLRTKAQAARTALLERLRAASLRDHHPDDVPEWNVERKRTASPPPAVTSPSSSAN
jgi:PPIC-type PPIASE domain